MLTHCVFIVDDYEPWRRQVRSALERNARWHVVAEAADAYEAISQAEAFRPDIILLDVGLPSPNGIYAARRILEHNPHAKILFVSQYESWDIAKAALEEGARGYVAKSTASSDLLLAMDAILEGRRFISGRLGRLLNAPTRERRVERAHEAGFYSSEGALMDDYVCLARTALEIGHTFVIIAESRRRDHLRRVLEARGIDVGKAMRVGRYRDLDLADGPASYVVNGCLDEPRFMAAATSLITSSLDAAVSRPARAVVCGEGAPVLLLDGNRDAAVRTEQLWHDLTSRYPVDTLCGYIDRSPGHACPDDVFRGLCDTHSAICAR